MVGQRPLKPFIGVRIPASEPRKTLSENWAFLLLRHVAPPCYLGLEQGDGKGKIFPLHLGGDRSKATFRGAEALMKT
jgi:hypothetical protein